MITFFFSYQILFLPSATKLRRLCFYTCLSLCSKGWSASVHVEMPSPADHVPPCTMQPPGPGTPGTRHTPRRRLLLLTSYWNAFLLNLIFAYLIISLVTKTSVNLLIISQTSYINYTKEPTVSLKHSKALNNLESH